jgi:hypothetical protein
VREVRRRDAGRAARSFDASDGVGARLLPTSSLRPFRPGSYDPSGTAELCSAAGATVPGDHLSAVRVKMDL